MYKIIGRDNLARETIADKLVIGWIPNSEKEKAQEFCDWMNSFSCGVLSDEGTYYIVVDNNHRLSRGMEDLV